MNDAAASAPRPTLHSILFLPVHCSPGNFGSKTGRIYQSSPLFPTAQVHLQDKSLLHAAVAGITASLGTGSFGVLSSETSSAGTSACCCWICKTSACCQLGPQFSGSCKLKRRVDKRKSKQDRGYNSDPSFVSSVPNTTFA